jgi:hypothetical protein
VLNSRSVRFGDAWPFILDDRDLLWEFELRAFFSCCLRNSLKCQIPEVRDLVTRGLLFWMVEIYLRSLGVQEFGLQAFRSPLLTQILLAFSWSTFSPDMCLLLKDQWPQPIVGSQLADTLIFFMIPIM